MESEDRTFGLLGKAGENVIDLITADEKDNSRRNKAVIYLALQLLAILLIVGTEPLKILLRKNIGRFALNIWYIVFSFLIYLGWTILIGDAAITFLTRSFPIELISASLLPGLFFYLILAFAVLVCGIKEYKRGLDHLSFYRGDSIFFGFLLEKGVPQQKIWVYYEPLTCLSVGIILALINVIIGLPIIVTSISFFVNEYYHVYYIQRTKKTRFNRMQVVSREMPQSTVVSENNIVRSASED